MGDSPAHRKSAPKVDGIKLGGLSTVALQVLGRFYALVVAPTQLACCEPEHAHSPANMAQVPQHFRCLMFDGGNTGKQT